MRRLRSVSRRGFGQGLGASLALAGAARQVVAHDDPHVVTVHISRFAFDPNILEIRPGDTVVWINEDLAPHTATARDQSWDTDRLETGVSVRILFETPGDFDYVCAYHPHMTGRVFVRLGRDG